MLQCVVSIAWDGSPSGEFPIRKICIFFARGQMSGANRRENLHYGTPYISLPDRSCPLLGAALSVDPQNFGHLKSEYLEYGKSQCCMSITA